MTRDTERPDVFRLLAEKFNILHEDAAHYEADAFTWKQRYRRLEGYLVAISKLSPMDKDGRDCGLVSAVAVTYALKALQSGVPDVEGR